MNADGSHRSRLFADRGRQTAYPVWSPDGRRIAFAQGDGDWELFVVGADGGDTKNVTDNTTADESPSWSPDGQAIAYACGADRESDICVVNADGSGRRTLIDSAASDWSPVWLPPRAAGNEPVR
jgi:TolB protein